MRKLALAFIFVVVVVVGVPVLLDQRVAQPFDLDPDAMPTGKEFLLNAERGMGNAESLSSARLRWRSRRRTR